MNWHRPLQELAVPIDAAPLRAQLPATEEVSPYGEFLLLEDHLYVLHRDGTYSFRLHLVVAPWSNQTLANWDQLQRWFNVRQSRTTFRQAWLYHPDGSRRKQKVHHQSDQAGNHYLQLNFKPLQPGVVVELEEQSDHFRVSDFGPAMWGQFLLQTGPPCRRRRLTIAAAKPFVTTITQHHGAADPVVRQQGDYQVHQWDLTDIPGIPGDLMPHSRDFLPWIDFSTVPSWRPIHRHLVKELSPKTSSGEPVRSLVQRLTQPQQSPREKLIAVHGHVAREIRYGRPPADMSSHQVREPSDILEELRGDCKDKSALLIQLLKEISLPARMAVVVTADDGRTPYLPSLRFNHAIVKTEVDGRDVWIDPAAGPFGLGELPRNVQGTQALLLGSSEPEMVTTPPARTREHAIRRLFRGTLTPEGDYIARVEAEISGEIAAEFRMALLDAPAEDRLKYWQRDVSEAIPGAEVSELQMPHLEDLSQPVKATYTLTLRHWARRTKNVWVARMPWGWTLNVSGALAAVERDHPLPSPLTCSLWERHELQLPPDVRPYGLPFQRQLSSPWMKYHCRLGTRAGALIAVRQISFRNGIIPSERYREHRDNWAAASAADQLDILLMLRRPAKP